VKEHILNTAALIDSMMQYDDDDELTINNVSAYIITNTPELLLFTNSVHDLVTMIAEET